MNNFHENYRYFYSINEGGKPQYIGHTYYRIDDFGEEHSCEFGDYKAQCNDNLYDDDLAQTEVLCPSLEEWQNYLKKPSEAANGAVARCLAHANIQGAIKAYVEKLICVSSAGELLPNSEAPQYTLITGETICKLTEEEVNREYGPLPCTSYDDKNEVER